MMDPINAYGCFGKEVTASTVREYRPRATRRGPVFARPCCASAGAFGVQHVVVIIRKNSHIFRRWRIDKLVKARATRAFFENNLVFDGLSAGPCTWHTFVRFEGRARKLWVVWLAGHGLPC